jgi:hypothetical protein
LGSGSTLSLAIRSPRQRGRLGGKQDIVVPNATILKIPPLASVLVISVTSSVTLALSATISSAVNDNPSIEELLKTGWQIAGYSQAFDNRSTFILFRTPDQSYLVQCRVGYDVTRIPSAYSLCYKLH